MTASVKHGGDPSKFLEHGKKKAREISLFPEDRKVQSREHDVMHVRVNQMRLQRPRQWGACWMAMLLWDQLQLDRYWAAKLPPSREGTRLAEYFEDSGVLSADSARK